jgi:hypothetical protein
MFKVNSMLSSDPSKCSSKRSSRYLPPAPFTPPPSNLSNSNKVSSITDGRKLSKKRSVFYPNPFESSDRNIYKKPKFTSSKKNLTKTKSEEIPQGLSDKLKGEFIKILENPFDFQKASKDFKTNEKIIISLLNKHPCIYLELNQKLQENVDIIRGLLATKTNNNSIITYSTLSGGYKIANASSETFTRNRNIALIAVENNDIFSILPEGFKSDEEIALAALKKSPEQWCYIKGGLEQSKKFIHEAIKITNGQVFKHFNDAYKSDYGTAVLAVGENSKMAQYVTSPLKPERIKADVAMKHNLSSYIGCWFSKLSLTSNKDNRYNKYENNNNYNEDNENNEDNKCTSSDVLVAFQS